MQLMAETCFKKFEMVIGNPQCDLYCGKVMIELIAWIKVAIRNCFIEVASYRLDSDIFHKCQRANPPGTSMKSIYVTYAPSHNGC